MQPAVKNLVIYQGDSFDFWFRLRVKNSDPVQYVDLTGYTGLAQIRADEDSPDVIAEFTVEITDQTVTLGRVNVSLTPAQTTALTDIPMMWDIELTGPTGNHTYMKGAVQLVKQVSRPVV